MWRRREVGPRPITFSWAALDKRPCYEIFVTTVLACKIRPHPVSRLCLAAEIGRLGRETAQQLAAPCRSAPVRRQAAPSCPPKPWRRRKRAARRRTLAGGCGDGGRRV